MWASIALLLLLVLGAWLFLRNDAEVERSAKDDLEALRDQAVLDLIAAEAIGNVVAEHPHEDEDALCRRVAELGGVPEAQADQTAIRQHVRGAMQCPTGPETWHRYRKHQLEQMYIQAGGEPGAITERLEALRRG